jgi:hypothetical protein
MITSAVSASPMPAPARAFLTKDAPWLGLLDSVRFKAHNGGVNE